MVARAWPKGGAAVARAGRRGGRLGAREAAACHRVPWAVTGRSVHARGSRPTVEGGSTWRRCFLAPR
jgi:hypothetical protein